MPREQSGELDPADWSTFRREAHAMLDDVLTHIETVRDRPVWRQPSQQARARFNQALPVTGRSLEDMLDDVRSDVMPFTTGNLHPRFMGWVHGAGTPVGVVAEMIAAGLNMNCGGRDHIGLDIEGQVVSWMRVAFGYPESASGLFLTGSSMANFLAVIVAKTDALGVETREAGLSASDRRLVAYTSSEAHGCVTQAMALSGIGSANLRRIPVDADGAMAVESLEMAIARDRAAGLTPFLIVATAGTVNTGALDPLDAIAAIAERERLWFHVDGAIGALAIFSGALRDRLKGIERSQSLALDFHKQGHVPYDSGFLLVRGSDRHKQAFANPAAYLQRYGRGLAAGETWPCDLGPDLSRGCRALKTWMTIGHLGADAVGASILKNCELARHFAARVADSPRFELKAPVSLNIVCFGIKGAGNGEINRALVADIQEAGIAAPSWTTIGDEIVMRCAIINHRTTRSDIDLVVDTLTAMAEARLG